MPLISEDGTCLRCRRNRFSFDGACALFVYRDEAAELIRAYKLKDHPRLASYFADALNDVIDRFAPGLPIVPVPGRPSRRREYGWDQMRRLAERLRRRFGYSVIPVLYRAEGDSQKSLGLQARQSNLAGKITCADGPLPSECVLIDDVLTTGATLSVCADVLKAAGVRRVYAAVLAVD